MALTLDHNTLLARTRMSCALHSGPDRAYKTVVHHDTVTVSLPTDNLPGSKLKCTRMTPAAEAAATIARKGGCVAAGGGHDFVVKAGPLNMPTS